jgi:hypothetical protein
VCAVRLSRRGPLWLLGAMLTGLFLIAAHPTESTRCFDSDTSGQICVSGRFLQFWEAHGGLPVFGEPVTEPAIETTPDGNFTVQYFDNARLELHPEHPGPYDVLIGRLGAERFRAMDRTDVRGKAQPAELGCRYFEETGKAVCGPFLHFWRTHGLRFDDDPGTSDVESLALLGLPLSTAVVRVNEGGGVEEIQWFERAGLLEHDGVVITLPLGRERARGSTPAPPSEVEQAPPAATSSPPAGAERPVAGIGAPAAPCDQQVPVPADGLQLWVVRPAGDDDQAVVCVRLILEQAPVAGANVLVYRRSGDETRPSHPQTTGKDGSASFVFYAGAGSPGMPEQVDAVADYQGITYNATVWPQQP